jgi:hypothetical protein
VPYRPHLAHPARATPFGRMSGLGRPPADQPWPILKLGVLSQWLHRFLHVCDHMAGPYDVASAEKSWDRARGVDRSVTVALSRFAGGLVWKPFFGIRQRCGQAGVLTGDGVTVYPEMGGIQPTAICRCAGGAYTQASSRADAGLPPAPPGSGECGALGSSPAWHPRPSR